MRIAVTKQPAFLADETVTSLLAAGTASDVWVDDEWTKDAHKAHGKGPQAAQQDH